MALTNKFGLPEPVFAAIANDPYDNGGSDITVTSLISPPQLVELKRRHADTITEDATARLWATYGQLMHLFIERCITSDPKMKTRYISETRMYTKVNNWVVSGQLDLFDRETATLYDFKFVGAFAVKMAIREGKIEWEQQLNLLRHLLFLEHGLVAEQVAIIGLIRDYSERIEKTDNLKAVEVIPFPIWPGDEAAAYLADRVQQHQEARQTERDANLPRCTDEERWFRNGKSARCERYCPAKTVCQQYQQTQEAVK